MLTTKQLILLTAACAICLLSACKHAQEAGPAYQLAQGCYALRSVGTSTYLANTDRNGLQFSATSSSEALKFYLKPSQLGRFLMWTEQRNFLARQVDKIVLQELASQASEWRIKHLSIIEDEQTVAQHYTILSEDGQLRWEVADTTPKLFASESIIAPSKAAIDFVVQPIADCAQFPEAALDAEVAEQFHVIKDKQRPVQGFVDFHTHIAFPKTMAAAAMSGDVFHRYGITHALADCKTLHGANGSTDLLESQKDDGVPNGHDTRGYPEFSYWPNRSTNTHVQAYYRWLQRAYLSGLRIIVTHVTGNPTYCELLGVMKPALVSGGCTGSAALAQQTEYIYQLQDYIDAQEGGPGKGWFRIVTSASQAREVIAHNKLAVILGSEHGALFDCREGAKQCTPEYVEQELDAIYRLGIRVVFPIHRFDNAFGGTKPQGGTDGAWMHLSSKLSTSNLNQLTDLFRPKAMLFRPIGGHYWDLQACPDGIRGAGNIRDMEAFLAEDFGIIKRSVFEIPLIGKALGPAFSTFLDLTVIDKLAPFPDYSAFSQADARACNGRPLQPVGEQLVQGMIDRGMIIEVDHMSFTTFRQTLEILRSRNYSGVVSSHGWFENIAPIRQQILALGGMIAPFNKNPSAVADRIRLLTEEMAQTPYAVGVGLGTDIQGVTSQARADQDFELVYPFQSIDQQVTFLPPKTGDRSFDYAQEGVAHYGLLPEWVENLRQVDQQDPADLIGVLMNSAEAYLQMWERAESHSRNATATYPPRSEAIPIRTQ